ncbi:MAG TPA: hypothetical protein VFP32_00525 [Candidatus Saccharimonadales bacterium]|nr:hypothetical protein [Candidatus Saccharimonadales bacterium]
MKYDFFACGRWRNHSNIGEVVDKLRAAGKIVYYFAESKYDGYDIHQDLEPADIEDRMKKEEQTEDWQNDALLRKIFEKDMHGLRESEAIVVVFPIGFSGHMELGAAYGMGKKCYGIGQPEKAETLYFMFDQIFPNVDEFVRQFS